MSFVRSCGDLGHTNRVRDEGPWWDTPVGTHHGVVPDEPTPEPPAPSRRARRGRRALPFVAIAAVSIALLGCQQPGEAPTAGGAPAAQRASSVVPGEDVYVRSCARCHGADLQGKSGTPPIDQSRLAGLGDQRLRLTIESGKGKMPGFARLSPAQVDSLISYLKAAA